MWLMDDLKMPSVAEVQMSAPEFMVGEGDGEVVVCVELSALPAGGLECELDVTLLPMPGEKTG